MAHLTLRRNSLERFELLSVVALAITYAVLSIALVSEWGRIVRTFDGALRGDATSALEVTANGDLP